MASYSTPVQSLNLQVGSCSKNIRCFLFHIIIKLYIFRVFIFRSDIEQRSNIWGRCYSGSGDCNINMVGRQSRSSTSAYREYYFISFISLRLLPREEFQYVPEINK